MTRDDLKAVVHAASDNLHQVVMYRVFPVYINSMSAYLLFSGMSMVGACCMIWFQEWLYLITFAVIAILLFVCHTRLPAPIRFAHNLEDRNYCVVECTSVDLRVTTHVSDDGVVHNWSAEVTVNGEVVPGLFDVDGVSVQIFKENSTTPAVLITDTNVWCVMADTRSSEGD